MPISRQLALDHIRTHTHRLRALPQRSLWPKYLFHITHVTNAIRIVECGELRARNHVRDFHDIANQGALNNYGGSHDFARLYFRPRNNFHIRTEGIKCRSDYYRQAFHASIPVAFVFNLEDVITKPGVRFTEGNIQKGANTEKDGDEAFRQLDFSTIYHDDYTTQANNEYIQDRRMAEVMVPGALPLNGALRAIVFRTAYDRSTFEFLAQQARIDVRHRLSVEKVHASIFMHFGLYLKEMSFISGDLNMKFRLPRTRPEDNRYRLSVRQSVQDGTQVTFAQDVSLSPPNFTIQGFSTANRTSWCIELEDVLAFEGRLPHQHSEVFGRAG